LASLGLVDVFLPLSENSFSLKRWSVGEVSVVWPRLQDVSFVQYVDNILSFI